MGGEPVWIAEDDRVTYHAALAHGSNHLVTLVAQSMQLLGEAGVDDPAPDARAAAHGGARERPAAR